MLVLRTSSFIKLSNQNCLYCSPLNFLPRSWSSKIILNYFLDESRESQTKASKNPLNTLFQLLILYEPACLQKYFYGRALSIRVFSSDRHYGVIVSARG